MANPVPQLLCRECKASVRVADKFCAACGVRLAGAGTPLLQDMPHERRQLTVMFCDLVGSTALAGRLDPEDLHAIFARYQRLVSDIVVDAGGVIARYQGDGILAYFGYPRAGEHDAEAAVRSDRKSVV